MSKIEDGERVLHSPWDDYDETYVDTTINKKKIKNVKPG